MWAHSDGNSVPLELATVSLRFFRALKHLMRCFTNRAASSSGRISFLVRKARMHTVQLVSRSSSHVVMDRKAKTTISSFLSCLPRGSIQIADCSCSLQRRIMSWLEVTIFLLVLVAKWSTSSSGAPRAGELVSLCPTQLTSYPRMRRAAATRQGSSSSKIRRKGDRGFTGVTLMQRLHSQQLL